MFMKFRRRAAVSATVSLILTATFVGAQSEGDILKITRPHSGEKRYTRSTSLAQLSREAVFDRMHAATTPIPQLKSRRNQRIEAARASAFGRTRGSASAPTLLSFGTGGGDISEIEPNDQVAQGVSLPVNLFGEIRFDGDVDFFAFQALAGQQITIEPIAARLPASQLVADIALFDSTGKLIEAKTGDENTDPLIRFVSPIDQALSVGISDADDLGGRRFDYILNITRGVDVDEQEPNDQNAQSVNELPATIFGDITGRDDVDFYSFTALAGQTLIVDVDAEVLGSRLDAEINVSDPETGVEFFYSDQNDGDDPRFNIVLPYTGRYVVGIGAFNNNSSGFYRINASLVSSAGAPIITSVTRLSKKFIEISGAGFTERSVVEVNSLARRTNLTSEGKLQAKIKSRTGDVVTVSNSPDDRRSNPLLVQ
ncbi:MAG TPA: PPC domain-containing protein [Blastocatellia bacterium]|nr:PPC domain-containing protein [Blastocatellia bacterium]